MDHTALTYTVSSAIAATGLPRTTLYDLMAQRKIQSRKLGRRTLIDAASLRDYLASLPPADIRPAKAA